MIDWKWTWGVTRWLLALALAIDVAKFSFFYFAGPRPFDAFVTYSLFENTPVTAIAAASPFLLCALAVVCLVIFQISTHAMRRVSSRPLSG
jgi:hypothetical protein